MAARRKTQPVWEELPPEPDPVQDLLDLRNEIDTGHHRAEIIEGQIVVSPIPVIPAPFDLTLDTSALPLPK